MAMNVAIRSAMDVMLERDGDVVVFGEDVGYFGGVFRCTDGLQARYGSHRVFDTPIAEGGIIGTALGSALTGLRPVAEMMYSDFALLAMDQIVNQAAKIRYMTGGQARVPLVVRMVTGGYKSSAAQHGQCPQCRSASGSGHGGGTAPA